MRIARYVADGGDPSYGIVELAEDGGGHPDSIAAISGDPLAGRDHELATIRRALSGGSKNSGVVIAGAAGVGKTRLAREVLTRAETAGERTNWIVGTESARALPLGAFTALISDAIADPMPIRPVIFRSSA